MNSRQFQDRLVELFQEIGFEAQAEWNVAKDSRDDFTRQLYSPRLDICVSPLNIDLGTDGREAINRTAEKNKRFIYELFKKSHRHEEDFQHFFHNGNNNPRCFLAIEIEKSGSRKHMLGDIINAAYLGKYGMVIAIGQKKYMHFVKILEYLRFCVTVGKARERFSNILLFESQDYLRVLERHLLLINLFEAIRLSL